MSRYAENTEVPTGRSRDEIERTLTRYGADQFMHGWDRGGNLAVIAFHAHGKRVQFRLPMPDPSERRFTLTPTGRKRSDAQAEQEWEKACRQSWRALALVIKAKLEAVEAGITVFEDEFLAHIMLPDGTRFGDHASAAIEAAYSTGSLPALLPGGAS